MDKNEITQLISSMIEDKAKRGLYDVTQVPYHIHNNLDSPQLSFIGLSDVPSSFSGQAGRVLKVNPTGTGIIFSSTGISYGGVVLSGGTAGTPFPAGWSVAHTGTGDYTITHNLGTTNYTFVGTLFANTGAIITFNQQNSNTMEILVKDLTGTLVDRTFSFIVLAV